MQYSKQKQNTQQILLAESMKGTTNLERTREIRTQLRMMNTQQEQTQKVFQGVSNQKDFVWDQPKSDKSETEELDIEAKYKYKEVASQIQRAKNSVSAGRALISARRKVLEIKRKMAASKGDAKELQLALTHAKRMEMVARKKKHNLEIEELVANTQKRDENAEKTEDRSEEMRQNIVFAQEDKVAEAEDKIFEERGELFDARVEELEDSGIELSEDILAELNEEVSELGEEELEQLEEAMQMLEELEVVNPHMSEENLEKLKIKHRNSENKAMVKADMDYMKELIKYETSSLSTQGLDIKV